MNDGSGSMDDGSDEAVLRREAEVLGRSPRLTTPRSGEAVEMALDRTNQLRRSVFGPEAPPVPLADVPDMVLSLMCHPALYDRIAAMSMHLFTQGLLPARERELAVLRTAWLCQAPYEWGEHVNLARVFGLDGAEIERVTEGSTAEGWSGPDRAILAAVEELHADAMVSDTTWDALSSTLDERQIFELTVLVGHFTLVAYFQNTLRFELAPGNEGLRAR